MKIWIDFINTPQVTFFLPFIDDFRTNNHEVILTCRDSGNTVALLKKNKLPFKIIGEGVGKGMIKKLLFFPRRIIQLYWFIHKARPDIAVSQSSFYQPLVACSLDIPCLYTNDNEHAMGNLFGFLFARKVFLPKALEGESFVRKWPLNKKVMFYPSVKEAIYLSQQPSNFKKSAAEKARIYFRPEPWSAEYYRGPLNFFDDTLIKLGSDYEVVILPRDRNQAIHYSRGKFNSIKVADEPLSLKEIASDCLLFIGAGGSMTREMAVMNIPVISIYQSELLSVDNYLIKKGLMKIDPKISYEEIITFINDTPDSGGELTVLKDGLQSFELIKKHIYNLKNE
jgi:predicted glycosyltransferase